MSGDVECSKGCGRSHGQRNVSSNVLPVYLPYSIQGGIASARANTGDTDYSANYGQDDEAEG